ncbi:ABC transporter ATP-binding protein [Azospirillum canadense]|uniref:ABC transporter ATP-binding protein n=1 Tax=Azospirillum canadense TaxID=403962 RepID=UPI0022280A16|nr:ABC transporter ATP-binding protein [Azospirillum canadense]MCW2241307.1 ABC-2 type transport system ATP-binding protein [Azospirillum canadense]
MACYETAPPDQRAMSGTVAEPVLAVEGLSHSFGNRTVLDDVSFGIPAGRFAVLLGLNGAGKTTLFSLITRIYNTRRGSIRVFGFDMRRQPTQALARIGVVFQQPTLDPDLTVLQNLRYHGGLHGLAPAVIEQRAAEELTRIGLLERGDERVRTLSGGQRRRVEIARALLHQPSLLLLDEPTVGLDIELRRQVLDHVHDLCRERGLAVLWATHLIDEARDGDGVVVLHRGRVLAEGLVDEVCAAAGAPALGPAFARLTERATQKGTGQ